MDCYTDVRHLVKDAVQEVGAEGTGLTPLSTMQSRQILAKSRH